MQAVFVMVKCDLGTAYDVAEKMVDGISEVSEIHSIAGRFDLLAKFYLPEDMEIGRFVIDNVQTIDGVADTHTLVTFKAFQ